MSRVKTQPDVPCADFFIGTCLIKTSSQEIVIAGQARHVRKNIADLLGMFARSAGKILPRAHIVEEIWHSRPSGNTDLTKAVSEIRKLFKDVMVDEQVIVTVPRVGYRLVAPVKYLPDVTDDSLQARKADVPEQVSPLTGRKSREGQNNARKWKLAVAALLGASIALRFILSADA